MKMPHCPVIEENSLVGGIWKNDQTVRKQENKKQQPKKKKKKYTPICTFMVTVVSKWRRDLLERLYLTVGLGMSGDFPEGSGIFSQG